MISKGLLATLLLVAGLAMPASAAGWPVNSKYFTFDREFQVSGREHRATENEAVALGVVMDALYMRYRSAGLPERHLDYDSSGRGVVKLYYEAGSGNDGNYAAKRVPPYRVSYFIRLNIAAYRKEGPDFMRTIAHELFHSIQRAFPSGAAILDAGSSASGKFGAFQYDWLLEGMADAAGMMAAHGVGGYSHDPSQAVIASLQRVAGMRSYHAPLHMYPTASFPRLPGFGAEKSYRYQTYYTSGFWRYILIETRNLAAFNILFSGTPSGTITPLSVLEWVNSNIKRLPGRGGTGKRFPAGLPQAYAEFIAEFADLPFTAGYAGLSRGGAIFHERTWQAMVMGEPGPTECAPVELSPSRPHKIHTVTVQEFGTYCFQVSVQGKAAGVPQAFEVNYAATSPADASYACQAVSLGSNGATIKTGLKQSQIASVPGCARSAPIQYAPRSNMKRQTVVLTNVHAAGGAGSISRTKPVEVRVDFVLAAASASGHMAPSRKSSSAPAAPPPPAPGAPAAAPSGASTGKNIKIKSTSVRARGKQRQHATARQKTDCSKLQDRCPQIEIDLLQHDERFETILAMGDRLGAGALVALDGAPRQIDVIGIYGNPEKLGAMAMELAGTEFTEVSLRIRAPEGQIEKGMQWDDAVIAALVGTMASPDNVDMHSRGPNPRAGSCLSDPAATGIVEITDVGEGWIEGMFSASLFENYVQPHWKDPCAARPATGQVSGTFTAPYQDVTQPPVEPSLAAYQVWAGLPAITWAVTDYNDLVEQAVASQRDLLRDWEAKRRASPSSGTGGGVGGPSPTACAQECFPGVMGCPNITAEEVKRLTPIYLSTLPASMRDTMRQQIERASPDAQSRLLAVGMDVKGCMETATTP